MALCCRNVSFAYDAAAPVLRDVSFSVERGERVALVAPSGYGKTTLCRIIAVFLSAQTGAVEIDGAPLARKGARSVQLIWQQPELAFDPRLRMSKSLREVSGYEEAYRNELLDRFNAKTEWLNRFPSELSGGELMRFCIVRALLARPAYLICDEMTAMLDAVTQAFVWKELISFADANQLGLLVVSHSPDLLNRVATRIIDLTACSR